MNTSPWPFAEVAVDVPLASARTGAGADGGRRAVQDTFTYAIPEEQDGGIEPGQRVWVPFGRRRVEGVVVALSTVSPVEQTRELEAPIDRRAVLSSDDIALARWMSAHYLAPFYECLRTLLPPGGAYRVETRYRRTARQVVAGRLSPPALALVGLFGRPRELTEAGLIDALHDAHLAQRHPELNDPRWALSELVEAGVLESEVQLNGPRVRAKHEPLIRLIVEDPEAVAERMAELATPGKSSTDRSSSHQSPSDPSAPDPSVPDPSAPDPSAPDPSAPDQSAKNPSATNPSPIDRSSPPDLYSAILDGLTDAGGTARRSELAAGLPAALRRALTAGLRRLEEVGLVAIGEATVWRDPLAGQAGQAGQPVSREVPPALTEDQAVAWSAIEKMLGRGVFTGTRPRVSFPRRAPVALIHGVTGSGKTEVYLRAIEHVILQGRQAIVLVPEIALTPQTVRRFVARFPGRVGVWHSELSDGERLDTWQRAHDGLLDVIVGSRSAVFAPLPRLGVIVLDEEHAESYKHPRTPRYHAREVAVHRAALAGAAVLLGSATPSVESYWRAEKGAYRLLSLPRRVTAQSGASTEDGANELALPRDADDAAASVAVAPWADLPIVQIVDMRAELKAGNTSIFSRALDEALARTLAAGEQAILFLNRRGANTFVLCRDCGHVLKCPRCRLPLTFHATGELLVCHHCNYRTVPPMMCPACGSTRIRYFGTGTQRVAEQVAQHFPEARVLRWDADTTGGRGAHEAIMAQFAGRGADVLIGTQMIAKGLDLPAVTLVGIVSADTALALPDFCAGERAFQLLTQVAGRAGRSALGGRVVLQTYQPDHPAIRFAAGHDYAGFYRAEIAFRAAHRYPPFSQLVRLEYRGSAGDAAAERTARRAAAQLRARIARLGLADTDVLGPAPAFFRYVRGRARWQLVVRSGDPQALLGGWSPGPGWTVDVGAVSLL